jgi:hypothetical protein
MGQHGMEVLPLASLEAEMSTLWSLSSFPNALAGERRTQSFHNVANRGEMGITFVVVLGQKGNSDLVGNA